MADTRHDNELGVTTEDVLLGEVQRLRTEIERLWEALREAIDWSYGEDLIPERRGELEQLIA